MSVFEQPTDWSAVAQAWREVARPTPRTEATAQAAEAMAGAKAANDPALFWPMYRVFRALDRAREDLAGFDIAAAAKFSRR